jgi:membrane-associated phospholipid phosphatase
MKGVKMKKKTILGMPIVIFYIICALLIIGIIIGSIWDFQISEALSNKTTIGDYFQKYGNTISNCMYPIAGICLFKGLRKKGKTFNMLAWIVLLSSIFFAIICDITISGKYLREVYGYVAGDSSAFIKIVLCLLTWVLKSSLIAFIAYKIIDDDNANKLIAVGSIIFATGVLSIQVNEWLKDVGSRPRFKYLITLDDPISEFRNWWQIMPYISAENTFKSWPSGHMTYATIMLCLPMLASVLKCKKTWLKYVLFIFAISWVIIFGYNRIHMNAHFLTDVCFAVLITYILYALTYKCVMKIIANKN